MHSVDATVCYGKDKKEAFENGLKVFDGILKYRREELGAVDWYLPFDGKEHKDDTGYRIANEIETLLSSIFIFSTDHSRNRFHHERWEPVIEGNSEKAKEIFDFLRMAEAKTDEGRLVRWEKDEELFAWIKSSKLWAVRIYIPANDEYGFKLVSLDEALKEVEGKQFCIVAVDMHS